MKLSARTLVSSHSRQRQRTQDAVDGGGDGDGGGENSMSENKVKVRNVLSRPCAAGCGHLCWAVVGSGKSQGLVND